jgi:hypothetical protein
MADVRAAAVFGEAELVEVESGFSFSSLFKWTRCSRSELRAGLTRLTHWSWFFVGLVVVTACNEAEFTGETPQRADDPPQPAELFQLTSDCDTPVASPKLREIELKVTPAGAPRPEHTGVYTGTFCPVTPKGLTALFIVDLSGSMSRYRDQDGSMRDGNDPLLEGSCGRLEAAKALVAKLEEDGGDVGAIDVRVGLVAFAGDVLRSRTISPVSLADFKGSALSPDTFCAHVAQDAEGIDDPSNPGGIDGQGVTASTNYEAAFRAAQGVLASANGRTSAYFISDGLPTAGGNDPKAAGVAAGKALREAVPTLVLNGLLLGQTGAEAKSVLEDVVGDPARVRLAAGASDLAKEILEFPDPTLSGLTVSFRVGKDGTPKDLPVASFVRQSGGQWEFKTESFSLPTESFHLEARANAAEAAVLTTALDVELKEVPREAP